MSAYHEDLGAFIIIIINKLQVGWHPVAVIECTEYI